MEETEAQRRSASFKITEMIFLSTKTQVCVSTDMLVPLMHDQRTRVIWNRVASGGTGPVASTCSKMEQTILAFQDFYVDQYRKANAFLSIRGKLC